MKMTIKSELVWSFVTLCGLVLCLSPFSIPVLAQTSTVGYNAVCTSSACNTASLTTSSPAFIDASVSATLNHTDLCATILNILTSNLGNPPYPSIGAVIDARGLTNLGCSTGTPWNN